MKKSKIHFEVEQKVNGKWGFLSWGGCTDTTKQSREWAMDKVGRLREEYPEEIFRVVRVTTLKHRELHRG
jgi:hypothetical protein